MRLRSTSAVSVLFLAMTLALGAFQWGRAQASAERLERRRTAVVDAVAHATPAMVSVDAWHKGRSGFDSRASGSGVIVHPDGYVVTNSHVVQGGERITVDLFGNRGRYDARVIQDDPSGDLAILKIQRASRFPYVSLAPRGSLMLGESAIAVGNPHGLGDSITVGVVSAIGRSAKMQNGATLRNLIQTDAAINIGNSGGALLNLDGELMGINVSLLPSAKGIAFAISADQVAASLQRCVGRAPPPNPLPPIDPEFTLPPPPPSLPKDRVAVPAPDGVGLPPPAVVTPMRPEDLGLTVEDTGTRVVVKKVLRNTPAEIAGLLVGDVILEIDGRPVEAAMELALAFSASEPGRGFYLQIRRGNEEKQAVLIAPK